MKTSNPLAKNTGKWNICFQQACATNHWTPQTAQSTKRNCSARTVTPVSTDPRATDSAVVQDVCPWTPVLISKPSKYNTRVSLRNFYFVFISFYLHTTHTHTHIFSLSQFSLFSNFLPNRKKNQPETFLKHWKRFTTTPKTHFFFISTSSPFSRYHFILLYTHISNFDCIKPKIKKHIQKTKHTLYLLCMASSFLR